MKPILETITIENAIHAFAFEMPFFEFKWHYHPEYELTYIVKGKGMRLVGDSYLPFQSGDLVLLGSGIPHTWESDSNNQEMVAAVVIQFSENFIESVMNSQAFYQIKKLLQSSVRGLFFPNPQANDMASRMKLIANEKGVKQIAALLNVFDDLTNIKCETLASSFYAPKNSKENETRINTVFNYIKQNAATSMSLEQAAASIHLTTGAFCKFFKKMTGKTFSDYVNEIRIGNACTLITQTDKTIAQIAIESGFENQTYFNRIFLKKKNCTPKQFRMQLNKV
ncbi:AraC family transcriptional regulator [Flavobacterium sp. N1994]|uniref:AraC family transcriptional regulator n=1 Tax=Flavobacterium sp. N1994 TaxID=2986827 RepID=UPI00222300C6|nr:AraC family transcriptional regulator [Flavobacterium sp. N1994]